MNHGSYIDHLGLDICFDEYNYRKLQAHPIDGTHHLWLGDNNEAHCQESHIEHDLIFTIELTWKCIFLFFNMGVYKTFFSQGITKLKHFIFFVRSRSPQQRLTLWNSSLLYSALPLDELCSKALKMRRFSWRTWLGKMVMKNWPTFYKKDT